jgi:O-succinylbenzoic acid--CoA ligase
MIPLFKYFSKTDKHSGTEPFIITGTVKYSFDEAENIIQKYSLYFIDNDIKAGNYIGILLDNCIEFVFSTLALMNIGAIPVLFNKRHSETEIKELFSFTGCKFLISKEQQQLPGLKLPQTSNLTEAPACIQPEILSQDTALIIFTSGSRNKPKGVMITYGNLLQSAIGSDSVLSYCSTDTWMATLPFYHIGGFSIIIRALTYRLSLYLPDNIKADTLKHALDNFNPAHISLVSTQAVRLLEKGYTPGSKLRSVLLGGGFFSDELVFSLLKAKWPIIKVYGSTECSSHITAHWVKDDKHLSSAGKEIAGNRVTICDEKGNLLQPESIGEIVLEGPVVTKGYVNNAQETDKKYKSGKYFTGDFGYLDPEGYLYLSARREDLIISGGENINPAEIEEAISKFAPVEEAAVFAEDDPHWGQVPAAVVKLRDKNEVFTLDILNNFLQGKIASFKLPKKLYFIDEFPKTELGKILKKELISGILKRKQNK